MCHNLNRISNLSSFQMYIEQNAWFPLCLYYSYNSNMLIALVSIKPVSPVFLVCCAGVSIILEIWVFHKSQYSVFELYLEPIVLALPHSSLQINNHESLSYRGRYRATRKNTVAVLPTLSMGCKSPAWQRLPPPIFYSDILCIIWVNRCLSE